MQDANDMYEVPVRDIQGRPMKKAPLDMKMPESYKQVRKETLPKQIKQKALSSNAHVVQSMSNEEKYIQPDTPLTAKRI